MNEFFKFDKKILDLAATAQTSSQEVFTEIDRVCETLTAKVLWAFGRSHISESHFAPTTGYGYGDRGREALDRVVCDLFDCEDAIIRHNFVSGTHAIITALFAVLRPGDTMVCLTGTPYDTLHGAIGLNESGHGSLKDFGIAYRQIELLSSGAVDMEAIHGAAAGAKVVYIQRSRGYTLRPSLTVEQIGQMIAIAKTANPDCIAVVDNCYGEFVEEQEPTAVGADLIIGSLIKNPGGGIALTGGYIAGREKYVTMAADRLTAPGVGKEVGCTLGQNRNMLMGLFYAPTTVANALKTAVFAAEMFSALGFEVTPSPKEHRADIIQAVLLGRPEALVAFCRGIQKGSPIDSFVSPEPWDMPGYDSKVIMAAGAFTGGASIELSADGPMREPYAVWLQGGVTYASGKLGVMLAAQSMLEQGALG